MHDHQTSSPAPDTSAIITKLRKLGMRKTTALTQVLDALASSDLPVTIAEISERIASDSRCDPATIYRMLEKLERAGVVRKLGMHERAMYFELLRPGHHGDYLLCTTCGKITKIPAACPVEHLENHLKSESGYRNLTHELVFYGICPDCPEEDPALA
ncbi:Fur family transcriptional regulator [Sulfuriroseicoccus oceanibius]|uniref:Transcriptional repressor n=1 Tax=Sulfuriroseicoccus oceanibius TaxID=2707525 RepID=A0A6B3LFM8_9BACT|nr:transcriptional repressor [Sulfuriroseicoccus oceanibius]QQL45486.1 transcriptional repressor [Sulfuriroseicoccus oceanibius]